MTATVVSTNVSNAKGTRKYPVPEGIVINDRGVAGDAHAGAWSRQISLLSLEIIQEFESEMGRPIEPGEFAENVTTTGLDLRQVGLLDRLLVGETELEVAQIGKACHGNACAIFREAGKCVMPKEGIFCRVRQGGRVIPQDAIVHTIRPFKIAVVTMSDRASRGEYEDRGGAEAAAILQQFLAQTRWHPVIARRLLSDEPAPLSQLLEDLERDNTDAAIVTGGTGIGPRDTTPEVVSSFCEKTIPGVMEAIRAKYGAENPNAFLSRSIAGVRGKMLVYAIPGSVRAVREYINEIIKTMEHAVLSLHNIDSH